MRNVAFGFACGVVSLALLASAVHAGEISAGNLVITQAWSRATPGGAPVAGGYLAIENRGALPDRLLSGATDAARKIEIHEMALDKGIMTMRPIEGGLFIEPGKTVKFEPGGRHLMFIGLAAPFREGEQVFVWFAIYRDATEYEECVVALGRSERWKQEVEGGLGRWVRRAPEVLRLTPTGRSRLRG